MGKYIESDEFVYILSGEKEETMKAYKDVYKRQVLCSFHYVLPKYSTTGSLVFIDNLKLQADKSSSGGGEDSVLLDENFDEMCIRDRSYIVQCSEP